MADEVLPTETTAWHIGHVRLLHRQQKDMKGQTDRQTDEQTQTDRQTDGETDRQTDR